MKKDNTLNMRETILEAAVNLFQANGYNNTLMDDIAEAVGLTKGGLYHYIEKKEDLLRDLHDQILDAFIERVEGAMEEKAPAEKKIEKWIEAHATIMNDYLGHIKVLFTEIDNYSEEMLQATVRKRDQIQRMLVDIIRSGISEGRIRKDIHPQVTGFLILGMLNWLYVWYRPNGPMGLEEIISNMKTMVTCGLGAGNATTKGEDPNESSGGDKASDVRKDEFYTKV